MDLKHLITPEEITARTVVTLNASAKKLGVAIPLAQGKHLRPLLGAKLFDELILFVQAATPDTEDALAELSQQVKDLLCAWTVVEAWPTLLAHVTEAGVVVKNGKDVSTQSDYRTQQDVLAAITRTAQYYADLFVLWLEDNKSAYPAYAPFRAKTRERMPVGGLG